MSKFKVGQKVEVNTEIQPESEYWEKGYWKIPKGHKSIITDIDEEGNCLIEYIEATFYVDSSFLNPLYRSGKRPHSGVYHLLDSFFFN